MGNITYDVTFDPEAIAIIGDVLIGHYIHAEKRFVGTSREEIQELYRLSLGRYSL